MTASLPKIKLSPKAWQLLAEIVRVCEASPAGYTLPRPNSGPAKALDNLQFCKPNDHGNVYATSEGKAALEAHVGPKKTDLVRVVLAFTIQRQEATASNPVLPGDVIKALLPALAPAAAAHLGAVKMLAFEVKTDLDHRRYP